MAAKKTIRVVTRAADGSLRIKDMDGFNELEQLHEQIGIDDCSTDLSIRGMPLFRGLIGPLPESKTVVRYESPDVFEALTKEWTQTKTKRRRRRTKQPDNATTGSVPVPKLSLGTPMGIPTNV